MPWGVLSVHRRLLAYVNRLSLSGEYEALRKFIELVRLSNNVLMAALERKGGESVQVSRLRARLSRPNEVKPGSKLNLQTWTLLVHGTAAYCQPNLTTLS